LEALAGLPFRKCCAPAKIDGLTTGGAEFEATRETAQLHDPKIEDKETRPPPRYNEGTLIEAMQNAWRFVDDEVLRERFGSSRSNK
jgi:hypothetical protein